MQMVGRGMRGVGFGGTETVNVVDFCDKWESFTKWLNPEDIRQLNTYHEMVYEKISPYLDEEEKSWLRHYTRPID